MKKHLFSFEAKNYYWIVDKQDHLYIEEADKGALFKRISKLLLCNLSILLGLACLLYLTKDIPFIGSEQGRLLFYIFCILLSFLLSRMLAKRLMEGRSEVVTSPMSLNEDLEALAIKEANKQLKVLSVLNHILVGSTLVLTVMSFLDPKDFLFLLACLGIILMESTQGYGNLKSRTHTLIDFEEFVKSKYVKEVSKMTEV